MTEPQYDCEDINKFYEFEEKRAEQKRRDESRERKPESLQSIQRRLGVGAAEAMKIQKSEDM